MSEQEKQNLNRIVYEGLNSLAESIEDKLGIKCNLKEIKGYYCLNEIKVFPVVLKEFWEKNKYMDESFDASVFENSKGKVKFFEEMESYVGVSNEVSIRDIVQGFNELGFILNKDFCEYNKPKDPKNGIKKFVM